MRCIRVEFNGFKRLAQTACNTDGKLIAFLGPNEAGKSSVLQGLEWLSSPSGELPEPSRNRSMGSADLRGPVVRAVFALNDADRAAVIHLPAVGQPRRFTMARHASGELRTGIEPALTRNPEPFAAAQQGLTRLKDVAHIDAEVTAWWQLVQEVTANTEASWSDDLEARFDAFLGWLRTPSAQPDPDSDPDRASPDHDADNASAEVTDPGEVNAERERLAAQLETVRGILQEEHPSDVARKILLDRAPRFALFTEADRDLRFSYNIADETVRANPPRALLNLLGVAGLDLSQLWASISSGDVGRARTAERNANRQLEQRLGSRWRQEQISVSLNVSDTMLEVLVVEGGDDGADTPITERSDGLRIFIALVAFLAWNGFEHAPILLIDEIETHLHYDAQADLLEVLATDVDASQVFYTTHSPGCLPRDLGTGVRLVAPSPTRRDASSLRNDFWSGAQPGFTPLLFAMGAGAAAFSAFRRAVLTEGAADMILLPSLLRLATGLSDLDYQIAPGLANYHGSGLELEETAARVVYLVDGDAGGRKHQERLQMMGIDDARVFALEDEHATEDYVDPARYLEVVNALFASNSGPRVQLTDLQHSMPISTALKKWATAAGVDTPSKTAVASVLVAEPETLRLTPTGAAFLTGLHNEITAALTRPSTATR